MEYGTALGVIRSAHYSGKNIFVYADKTRPRLQGARLTAWELVQEKISCKLIADNAAATLIRDGKINLIVVGADRIAANGDTANKIGTFMLSTVAKVYNVPEVTLAKELGMCYATIGIITNFCTGMKKNGEIFHDIKNAVGNNKERVMNVFLNVFKENLEQEQCRCNKSTMRL